MWVFSLLGDPPFSLFVRLDPCLRLCVWEFCGFSLLFFFFQRLWIITDTVHACDNTVRETKLLFTHYSNTVLFMGPTTTLFRKNKIKISPIALFTHYLRGLFLESRHVQEVWKCKEDSNRNSRRGNFNQILLCIFSFNFVVST